MNRRFDRYLVYKALTLFVIWLLLTASYTPAHMALGFVASFGVALLNTDAGRPPGVAIRWLQLLQFLPWLFGRILISGLHLSFLILHPKLPIAPALIRYRTKLSHEPGIVLLGSSITLTPGTVTAEAYRARHRWRIAGRPPEPAVGEQSGGRVPDKEKCGMNIFLLFVLDILAVMIIIYLYRVIRGPTLYDRVLGLNGISTKAIIILIVIGTVYDRVEMFVDISTGYALLNLVGVLAITKYLEQREAPS